MAWVKCKGKVNVPDYDVLASATWDFSNCAITSAYTAGANHWTQNATTKALTCLFPTSTSRSNCASTQLINLKPYKTLSITYKNGSTTYNKTLDISSYKDSLMICLMGAYDSNNVVRSYFTLSTTRTYPLTNRVISRGFPNWTTAAQSCSATFSVTKLVLSASEVATTSLEDEEL